MHVYISRLARLFALLGGTVLTVLILQTCLSIVGRSINTILHSDFFQSTLPGLATSLLAAGVGPINGDFELVEAGMPFVIFAFIPLCQLEDEHASVDVFANRFPPKFQVFMRAVIETIFAGIIVLIAWQLAQGMLSKLNSGQTTFLLQFPVWWAYALSLTGAIAAAIVAVYVAVMRVIELKTGQLALPTDLESEH